MTSSLPNQISHVDLHPASYKYLLKGHPWIIKDNFTAKFRAKDRLLWATDKKTGKQFTLLNDTAHPKIKARFWSVGHIDLEQFREDLLARIQSACMKRKENINERDDVFLTFGEADRLSGLFLLLLKDGIVIQSYSKIWKKYQKDIVPFLREQITIDLELDLNWVAWQDRDTEAKSTMTPLWGKMPEEFTANEFGVQYKLNLTQGHDLGLYPDMAGIRKQFARYVEGKKVLNLYCYTGAWSLFTYANGASFVTSVDLSAKYMDWLKENINLNSYDINDFDFKVGDALSAMKELEKEGEKFDLIICDPPSFSSDGKKSTNALKNYENLFPAISKLLTDNAQALLFINTHGLSKEKFEVTMNGYAVRSKLKKLKSVTPSEDIRSLQGFPEGDYLKGILFTNGEVPRKFKTPKGRKGKYSK